jgi:PAS domain S-box-containing protein
MSVRFKIFLCLALVALVVWGSCAYLASEIITNRLNALDRSQITRSSLRVFDLLEQRQERMAASLPFWARLLPPTVEGTEARRVLESLLEETNLNTAVIIGPDGRLLNLASRNSMLSRGGPLPESDLIQFGSVAAEVLQGRSLVGAISTSQGPFVFGATPFFDERGNRAGVLLAGFFLDSQWQQQINTELLTEASLLPPRGEVMENFRGAPATTSPVLLPPEKGSLFLEAFLLLRDTQGEPLLLLALKETRENYIEGLANLRFFLGLTGAIGLILVVVGTLAVEVLVTSRIRKLTLSAKLAEFNGMEDLPPRLLQGKDEISQLAKTSKSTMDRLRNSQALYRAVVETQSELLVRFRPDGSITFANDAFARFFGRSTRGIDSTNITDFLSRELLGFSVLEMLPTESARSRTDDIRLQLGGGEEKWIQWHQRGLTDELRQIREIQAAGVDITMRRNYAEKLQQAKEAAEAADRAKSEFLSVMSHETRTPLNSILGFTQIMISSGVSEQQRDYLQLIEASGNALLVLLNDLLDYSNVASGRIDLRPVPVNVRNLAHELIGVHWPEAKEKGLALDWDMASDAPLVIQADINRVRQVLHNVVANAVKFTTRGFARLSVSRGPGETVEFHMQDTGCGIPEAIQDKIFQPFLQVDSREMRKHGGAGIGLAVSKKVLDCLGGKIEVRSQVGLGSLFIISLPIGHPEAAEVERAEREVLSTSDADFSTENISVLVVDDNKTNLKVQAFMLESMGVKVQTAEGGQQAMDLCQKGRFDLIFMDVQMPDVDGFQATQRLREREQRLGLMPPIYVVACTAFSLPGDREKCLESGMDDYVSKPVRKEALAAALRLFLSRRQLTTSSLLVSKE